MLENLLRTLLAGLQALQPSPECEAVAAKFICTYYFGLCDDQTGQVYFPSVEECVRITEDICANELEQAARLVGEEVLPHCDSIPAVAQSVDCEGS